ncbi:MAG TPA: response regulator [Chloroflexota bacterium]|jgi:twitching motility two-component system response regulator PilG
MIAPPVIVVIDDSPTIRKIMDLTLQRMGLRMVGAASGVAGLAVVAEHNPALIFLDIVLPNVNGYQLCQVIKRNERYRNTPVIMLSGKDGIFDKVRGRLAGANDYITKPFEPGAVMQVIQKYVPRAVAQPLRVPVGSAR